MTSSQELNFIFAALADETRRNILKLISAEPLRVTDIAKKFEMSLNGVSKHLKILERANLLVRRKEGRVHFCQTNPVPLIKANDFIKEYEQFWQANLLNLEKFLNEDE